MADTELLEQLRDVVGAQNVLCEASQMEPWLNDWRGRYAGRARAVVLPSNTEQVAAVVQVCAQHSVPIVPQGGNTGLCGGATPAADGTAIVLKLSHMNRIRHVDASSDTLVAEAGCTLKAVQRAAENADRLFPLSLASEDSCEIGGNVSTNAGGVQVLHYGNMRELVLGVEAVLPDGRVWEGLRTLRKDNAGYDLKQLFIGAEGTLGIVTAVALRLFSRPTAKATAWVQVRSPSVALKLLGMLRAHCGDRLVAFELIGRTAIDLVLSRMTQVQDPLPRGDGDWAVLMQLHDAGTDSELEQRLGPALDKAMQHGLVTDKVLARSREQARALWLLRESVPEAQRLEGVSIKHDIALPLGYVEAFLQEADEALERRWPGVRVVVFGHVGDGNLHYNVSYPSAEDNAALIARQADVNRVVYDCVHRFQGTIAAEHGLGQLKQEQIKQYRTPVEIELMQRIKDTIDPAGLMNPGKVV